MSASNCPDVEMTVTFNIAESTPQGTITVTKTPRIQGVVGTAIDPYNLSSCVTVSNGKTPSFSWNETYYPKPSWLTLTGAGVLSGTPSYIPEAGRVTVSADNCTSVNLDITWDIINAGTITIGNQTIDGTVGNSLSFNLSNSTTVSNGQKPTFAVKSGTLPTGIDLSSEGVFTGTPSATSSATVVVTITARGCPTKDVNITFDITEAGGETPSDGWPTKIVVSNASSIYDDVSAFNGDYVRTGETLPILGENVPIWSNGSKYIYGVSHSSLGGNLDEPAIALYDSTGRNDVNSSYAYRMKSDASTAWKTADAASNMGMTLTITEVFGGESGGSSSSSESSSSSSGSEEPAPSDGWPTKIVVSDATATRADSSWSDKWNGTYTRTGDTTTALGETIPVWSNGKYYVMGYGTDMDSALSEVGIGFFTNKNSPDRRGAYFYRAKSATTWTSGEAGGPGLTMTITEDYTSGGESSSSETGGGVTYTMSRTSGSDSHMANALGTYSLNSGTDGNTDAVYVNKNGWRIYYNTSNSRWALGESAGDEQFICSTLEGTYTAWDYECNDVLVLKKDGEGGGTITFPESFSVTACDNIYARGNYSKTSNTTTVNGTDYPVYSFTNPSPLNGDTFCIYVCGYKQGKPGVFWTLNKATQNPPSAGDDAFSGLGSVAAGADGLPSSTTWTASGVTTTVSWT